MSWALDLQPGLTLAAARQRVVDALQAAELPDAELDARIFMEDATGLGRAALLGSAGRLLDSGEAATLERWVARRLAGEHVFRILGRREFWGLSFEITPDVLDPRPDTETIVSAALEALGPRRHTALRLCDLGTGSAAILAALLTECREAVGWGVDRSFAACVVARRNLAALGLGGRAGVLQAAWGTAFAAGGFDLIVSNPPYIETPVIPGLAPEVRDHDPPLALDGGSDGLDCYRLIAADLPSLLVPGGAAVLEVGTGQAPAVLDLLASAGLVGGITRPDLGGHERAVVARLPPV